MELSLATCLSKEDKRSPAGCRDIISGRGQNDPLVERHWAEPCRRGTVQVYPQKSAFT